eukprot:TRINITY_DN23113_c0_g1_i1.p1 TRINITY_DN23113_c0_g1~~TRINITY_DN23113_c0_g1_i1.p1  ORF type:complete len:670 (-),score=112.36 TRINITY_DN23113_c0_g1_i1:1367-3337(-)
MAAATSCFVAAGIPVGIPLRNSLRNPTALGDNPLRELAAFGVPLGENASSVCPCGSLSVSCSTTSQLPATTRYASAMPGRRGGHHYVLQDHPGSAPQTRHTGTAVATTVSVVDSLSLATNDEATARAAASQALALARRARDAAAEVAAFALLQRQLPPPQLVSNLMQARPRELATVHSGKEWNFSMPSSPESRLSSPLSFTSDRGMERGADLAREIEKMERALLADVSTGAGDGADVASSPDEDPHRKSRAKATRRRPSVSSARLNAAVVGVADVAAKAASEREAVGSLSSHSLDQGVAEESYPKIVVKSRRKAERLLKRERATQKVDLRRAAGKSAPLVRATAVGEQAQQKGRLLTAAEEAELSKGIQELLVLERAKAALEEEMGREANLLEWAQSLGLKPGELERKVKKGRQARNSMLLCNLRLVYSVANKYTGRGIPFGDLVTDGCKGLVRGAEKFDHTKGFKFSTYAHWWIRQAINKTIMEQSRTVRLPCHLFETLSRINRAREMIFAEFGRMASDDEVAELVGITPAKMASTLKCTRAPISTDASLGKDGDDTIGDFLSDPADTVDAVADLTRAGLRSDLENLLYTLTPRERDVVSMRYGLHDGRPRTLEEVGNRFQVTRERIRQIEQKAIRKLRHPSRSEGLRDYLTEGC